MAVRVAHLIYGLGLGGLEQLVVHLAAHSRARGIESSIVALGHDGPMGDLARKQDIDVELLPAGQIERGAQRELALWIVSRPLHAAIAATGLEMQILVEQQRA